MTTVTELGLSAIGSAFGEVSRLTNLAQDHRNTLSDLQQVSNFYDLMIRVFEGNTYSLEIKLSVSGYGDNQYGLIDYSAKERVIELMKNTIEEEIKEYRRELNRLAKEMVNE